MKNFFNKWVCNWVVLAIVLGIALGGAFNDFADAALKAPKRVAFMGWQYDDNLGNTTGNTDNVLVGSPNVPDEYNCLFSVTNSTGSLVQNTATVQIRTSYDNVLFDVVQTVAVANGLVLTGVRNVPATNTPFSNYWDMNITALLNANGSRVNAQCVFE